MNRISTFRKTGFFYTFLTVVINATLNMVMSVVPSPAIDEYTIHKWVQFLADSRRATWLAVLIPYAVPLLFCFCYTLRGGTEKKLRWRAMFMPAAMAQASLCGWFLNFSCVVPFALYAKYLLGISIRLIILTSLVASLLIGISSFTMVYLVLESLNQKFLLPVFFPEGKVSSFRSPFRPTFGVLLTMTFIISSLWPLTYVLYGMISLLVNNGLEIHKGLLGITSMLLLTAVAVTVLLSKKIVRPLTLLTQAAERIKTGDYSGRLAIISNDEMGTLVDTFNDMTASLAEKEFMRDTFGRVVDPSVRDYLMKGGIALHGESREVTVMFCDIRNFTAMSEKMAAEDVVSLLNRYFTVLGKCIARHNGIINKYIGDAIMAMFGVPVASSCHAADAYRAALDMRQALAALNAEFRAEGKPELHFGIGIHTGRVFAGTIGAEDRMEYTIIGDTVNTASRIESLCKTYRTDILLSEASAAHLEAPLRGNLHFVDDASIRGKEDKIKLYTAG